MAGRVRQPIDIKALEAYIEKNVPEIKVPLDVKQFGFGQSNPTYQLTSSTGQRFVMRKKPPGKLVSKTAHKVEREYRIIHALEQTDVPVPKAYCLCEDESIIGTPFYIMEFLDGRIIEDPAIPGVDPATRTEMWNDAIRTLAKLHRVDPAKVGLGSFGKSNGFYNRQLATWQTICAAQASTKDVETGEPVGVLPHFEETIRYFGSAAAQPRDRGTLIHGDYKIDNLVYHKTEPRVIGILDWEMSTIGHPLSDLANFLTPFYTARLHSSVLSSSSSPSSSSSAAPSSSSNYALTPIANSHAGFLPGATPGLPAPPEIAALYATTAGWGPGRWDDSERELRWSQAFNIFRQAAICQGIAARAAARQASSEVAKRYADARAPLAEFAWVLIQEAEAEGKKSRAKL